MEATACRSIQAMSISGAAPRPMNMGRARVAPASASFGNVGMLWMGRNGNGHGNASERSQQRPLVVVSKIREIFMPALSSTMTEGKIVSWIKGEGEKLSKGESVVVVESDKADMDVETFYDGYLAVIVVGVGEVAPVGAAIGLLAESEAEIEVAKSKGAKGGAAAPAAPPPPSPPPPTRRRLRRLLLKLLPRHLPRLLLRFRSIPQPEMGGLWRPHMPRSSQRS